MSDHQTHPSRARADRVTAAVQAAAIGFLRDAFPDAPVDAWRGLIDSLANNYGRYLDARFAKPRADHHRANEANGAAWIDQQIAALLTLGQPWRTGVTHAGVFSTVLYNAGCDAYRDEGVA